MIDDRCDRTCLWVLFALIAALPLVFLPTTIEVYVVPKAALLWIAVYGVGALLLARDLAGGRIVFSELAEVKALAVFCLAAAAATIGSASPMVSLLGAFMRREGLITLVAYAVLYVLVLRLVRTQREVWCGVWALVVPVVPTAVYSIAQAFGFEFVRELNPAGVAARAYGMLGNADFLGIYMALMVPVLAAVFLGTNGWRRAYVGCSLLVGAMALLLSYSRGGWLGASVGLCVLGGLMVLRRRRGAKAPVLIPTLAVAGIISLAILGAVLVRAAQPKPPETDFMQRAASIAGIGRGTAATRLEIWPRAVVVAARRPLFGFGPEGFRGPFMPIRGERLVRLEGSARWDRPHNALLYLAASVGLVGLIAYAAFMCVTVLRVVRAELDDPGHACLAGGLVAGALGAVTSEFFVFWSPAVTPLVFTALALAAAQIEMERPGGARVSIARVPATAAVVGVIVAAVMFAGICWAAVQSVRADYFADRGRAAAKRGRQSASVFYYEQAVTAAPWINDYRWRAARGWERAGFLARDVPALRRAEAILKDGLRVDPYDEQGYAQIGDVYRYLATIGGQDTMRQAMMSFKRALVLDPYSPTAHGGLAHLLFVRGDYRAAIGQARRVLAFDPKRAGLLSLVGYSYERMGRKDLARKYYERAIKADPRYSPAREGLKQLER